MNLSITAHKILPRPLFKETLQHLGLTVNEDSVINLDLTLPYNITPCGTPASL